MIVKKVTFKASQTKASFQKLSNYILDKEKAPVKLMDYMLDRQNDMSKVNSYHFSNCSFEDDEANIAEIVSTQSLNTKSKQDKTLHLIVSFREDENPSRDVLDAIEQELAESLGMSEHQRLSVVHDNTNNLHMHIAINKIDKETAKVINPYNDVKILQETAIKLEKKYKLEQDNHIPTKDRAKDKYNIHDMTISFENWVKDKITDKIDEILNSESSKREDIDELLSEYDLELRERRRGYVVSSKSEKVFVKSSSIHRVLSKQQLEKRFGEKTKENQPSQAKDKKASQIKESYKPHSKEQGELFKRYQELKSKEWQEFKNIMKSHITISKSKSKAIRDSLSKSMKPKQISYRDFLISQALLGNSQAIEALRRKKAVMQESDNNIYSSKEQLKILTSVDYVTKEGYLIYKDKNNKQDKIIDKGEFIKVSTKTGDKDVLLNAILLSIERYGKELNITGDDKFKMAVLDIVDEYNLDVRFIDSAMEQINLNNKVDRIENSSKRTIADAIKAQIEFINSDETVLPSRKNRDVASLSKMTDKLKYKNTQTFFKNEIMKLGIDSQAINTMDTVDINIKVDSFMVDDNNIAGMRAIHEEIKKSLDGEELKKFEKWLYVFDSGDKITNVTKAFYTNKGVDIEAHIKQYDMTLSKVDKVNKAIDITSSKNQQIIKEHTQKLYKLSKIKEPVKDNNKEQISSIKR